MKKRKEKECDKMATASFTKDFVVRDPKVSAKILRDLKSNKSTLKRMTEEEKKDVIFIGSEEELQKLLRR